MNDSQVTRVPSADRAAADLVHSTQRAWSHVWRRRLLLGLPRLWIVLVVAALGLGASLQFSPSQTSQGSGTVYTVHQVLVGL